MHDGSTYGAKQFCNRFASSIMTYMKASGCTSGSCTPVTAAIGSLNGCGSYAGTSVTSTLDLTYNGFMFGPILTTLMVPVAGFESVQQAYLDALVQWGATYYASTTDYFALAQLMISYTMIGGHISKPI
jgi:hypothetical protein